MFTNPLQAGNELNDVIQSFGVKNAHLAEKPLATNSTPMAAWFVSNCNSRSGREKVRAVFVVVDILRMIFFVLDWQNKGKVSYKANITVLNLFYFELAYTLHFFFSFSSQCSLLHACSLNSVS